MITESCAEVHSLLSQVERAKQNEQLVEKLRERKSDLNLVRDKLRVSDKMLAPLRTREFPVDAMPDAEKAFQRVSAMRDTLEQNPEDITKGRDFTTLCKTCDKLAGEVQDAVASAWTAYVERFRAKVDQAQLQQYARFPSHTETVRRIESLETETRRLQRKPPVDEEAMTALEQKWEEMRTLAKTLPPTTSDEEIQAFIDAACSRSGAALELLTAKVRDWLADQKMTDRFRVVLDG